MVDDLLQRHRRHYERVVVILEGVYSMDGDFPDLPRFVNMRDGLCRKAMRLAPESSAPI